MQVELVLGMAMLGRAVVEIVALGFGLGLLGFALRQVADYRGEKLRTVTTARAARIVGERAGAVIPCGS